MSTVGLILPLGLLGAVVGLLLAVFVKRRKNPSVHNMETLSADQLRRLAQLKSQLESGLITDREYQAERKKLLRT
jgi:hypothetical protein